MTAKLKRPLLAALLLAFALPANATMLRQMTLVDLATRADKVFRGRVVGIDSTTVRAGGSDLPVMVYRLKVDEVFKGQFDAPKGEPVVELRMIASSKATRQVGNFRKLSVLRDLPQLEMGRDYVLFTTRPSAIGLSSTVGLGQGAFTIVPGSKGELVANAFGNAGLTRSEDTAPRAGSMPYAQLKQAIRNVLTQVKP
jgi:hypothetical protein